MKESAKHKTHWQLNKYASDADYKAGKPYEEKRIEGNLLLNEGVTALLNLLTGAAETAFNQTNTYIGVGDSNTAAADTQTELQASTNKAWVQCDGSYPSISNQTVTWRGVFGDGVAEFAWEEFTVNSSGAANDTGDNLNRKTSSEGTKASGQTWTLDCSIEFN